VARTSTSAFIEAAVATAGRIGVNVKQVRLDESSRYTGLTSMICRRAQANEMKVDLADDLLCQKPPSIYDREAEGGRTVRRASESRSLESRTLCDKQV
jgi:hypothetical protein